MLSFASAAANSFSQRFFRCHKCQTTAETNVSRALCSIYNNKNEIISSLSEWKEYKDGRRGIYRSNSISTINNIYCNNFG